MKLTLTNRDAQRMLGALKTIDAGGEVKFSGQTRMNIAININRVLPIVAAFEIGSQKRQLDFQPGPEAAEGNKVIQRELIALADATNSYDLVPLKATDLNLDENAKITGDQIAALMPLISNVPEAEAKAA